MLVELFSYISTLRLLGGSGSRCTIAATGGWRSISFQRLRVRPASSRVLLKKPEASSGGRPKTVARWLPSVPVGA